MGRPEKKKGLIVLKVDSDIPGRLRILEQLFHFSLESVLVVTSMRKICCAVLRVSHEKVLMKN